ncbi:60Kd inner membrane protein [Novymonas esmeraldas]|uniref:60Kd inner membrane protein n=1 Tax=Novymonas esmeraldas TaxID=1808958 RepID=A0AAW0EKM3_9TRYP
MLLRSRLACAPVAASTASLLRTCGSATTTSPFRGAVGHSRHPASLSSLSSSCVGRCRHGGGGAAAVALHVQCRGISWNPLKWGQSGVGRSTTTQLEEELPEIFASQPTEVDDYIRPDKSWFERLEDFWDWAVSFLQPVEKQVEVMRSLRHDGVLSVDLGGWGHVFFFYGVCMRLLTLIPALYSHRNSLRMAHIGPQLSEITNNQNKAKNDRTLSTAEKRVIKEGYSRMKMALCKKHGCAQWKSFITMFTAPVTMSAFLSIRRLAMYETDLEMAPFLWVRDLTMPDPTYALPAICAGMFLLNFEMNQRMQRGGRSSSNMYMRWVVRVSSVVGVYFFAAQPSAMFAYWIGLSTAGLLQPILLRWQPFRDLFAFPEPPQAAKSQILSEVAGPSLYERLFASQEERTRMEEQRRAERAKNSATRIETVEDYDVVFDDGDDSRGGDSNKKGALAGRHRR